MERLLITGGIKSGKSSYALKRAGNIAGDKLFLATAVPFDKEMEDRISRHRNERGDEYITIEEPVDIHLHEGAVIILDCLTVWMNNLFHFGREDEWSWILKNFLDANNGSIIVVTNELGMGNIPMDPETRKYNEYLAAANKKLAEEMDEVVLMVSGIALQVKGNGLDA